MTVVMSLCFITETCPECCATILPSVFSFVFCFYRFILSVQLQSANIGLSGVQFSVSWL